MSKQHRRLGQGVCLRLVTLLLVVAQVLVQVWNLSRRSETPPRRHTHEISTEQPKTTKAASHFSPEWVMQYAVGDEGCHLARGSYNWRGHGLGNNINDMLNAWVYALAVEKWSDMAVVIDERQLGRVECREESLRIASTGWECLFLPMPHLCTFPNETVWVQHMMSKNVPRRELAEAISVEQDADRYHPEQITLAVEGVDHLGALAGMARYLWSNITPWLQADISAVVRATGSDEEFEQSPFLALHISRGDKARLGEEAEGHDCTEYLAAAVAYLEGDDSQLEVADIKGIWVASDEAEVVNTIKAIAPSYLPNVDNATILSISGSGGVEGGPEVDQTATLAGKETYGGFVHSLADIRQCTEADVFVGTLSSNMGRLLVLLRESIGLKPRNSAISIDRSWKAGR